VDRDVLLFDIREALLKRYVDGVSVGVAMDFVKYALGVQADAIFDELEKKFGLNDLSELREKWCETVTADRLKRKGRK